METKVEIIKWQEESEKLVDMTCVYEVSFSSSGKRGVCYGCVTDLRTMEALGLLPPHCLFTPLVGQCSLVQQWLWLLCEYRSPGIELKYKSLAAYEQQSFRTVSYKEWRSDYTECKQVLCQCIPWVFEGGWGGGERNPLVLELNTQEYSAEDKNLNGCCYCALYCQ